MELVVEELPESGKPKGTEEEELAQRGSRCSLLGLQEQDSRTTQRRIFEVEEKPSWKVWW